MIGVEKFIRKLCDDYNSTEESAIFSTAVGKCPRCGKTVYARKLTYSCEDSDCGFKIWKKSKVPQAEISLKQAAELLSKKRTKLTAVKKDGTSYTAEFTIEDTGEYINLVFAESTALGKCPNCKNDIAKGQYGFYCKGKCGIGFKVYGKQLTEAQIKKLLSGKELELTVNDKKTVVLPQLVPNEYQGKTYYNFRTKKA